MPAFEAFDVVKVPFPYTDRPVRQRRPAVVVAAGPLTEQHGLLWVVMVTSAENRGWHADVAVTDLGLAGLPTPSLVRCAKVATIEAAYAESLGKLGADDRRRVGAQVLALLGQMR